MHNEDIQSILSLMVNRIVRRFDPEKIILFGSHASGVADVNSDVDLLIVLDTQGATRQKANEIDLLLADRTIPLDVLVVTSAQYREQKAIIGTIVHEADKNGKVIYEHAA